MKFTLTHIQIIGWIGALMIMMVTMIPNDPFWEAASYSFFTTSAYAAIIYGNVYFLYPVFFEKRRYILYALGSILLLIVVGVTRGYLTYKVWQTFFAKDAVPLTAGMMLSFTLGLLLFYLFSFVFRIALAYLPLKKHADDVQAQKTQAELLLLKAQLQPHFLFNTLNNIYYEAYKESPRTADLIEKLSDIMRYFVDETPKDLVPIGNEVKFIENYIALEQIRLRYQTNIVFNKNYDNLMIPPMILMTLIENIFKHGIDRSIQNDVVINLAVEDSSLVMTTQNRIVTNHGHRIESSGIGLKNLRNRLTLLYNSNFELRTDIDHDIFLATLRIPIESHEKTETA